MTNIRQEIEVLVNQTFKEKAQNASRSKGMTDEELGIVKTLKNLYGSEQIDQKTEMAVYVACVLG